jgi:hypothetical protein
MITSIGLAHYLRAALSRPARNGPDRSAHHPLRLLRSVAAYVRRPCLWLVSPSRRSPGRFRSARVSVTLSPTPPAGRGAYCFLAAALPPHPSPTKGENVFVPAHHHQSAALHSSHYRRHHPQNLRTPPRPRGKKRSIRRRRCRSS